MKKLPFKPQISFTTVLFLLCLVCNIVFTIASGKIVYQVSTDAMLNSSMYYTNQIIKQTVDRLDQHMDDLQLLLSAYSKNDSLITCIQNRDHMSLEQQLFYERKQIVYLEQIGAIRPEISSILLVGTNGYLYSDDALGNVNQNYDYQASEWFQNAIRDSQNRSMNISTTYVDFYKTFSPLYHNRVVTLSVPVYDYGDQVIGAIFCFIDSAQFHKSFQFSQYSGLGSIFLINDNNEIVLHPNQAMLGETFHEETFTLTGTDESQSFPYNDTENIWTAASSELINAKAVCQISTENILAGTKELQSALVVPIFLCTLFSMSLCFLIYLLLKRSMNKLLQNLNDTTWEEHTIMQSNYHFTEFNRITGQYTALLDRLIDLTNKNHEIQLSSQMTQMNALLAQINPHFLFNTLQMLQTELVYGSRSKADQTIVSLGKLFRYAVNQSAGDITLSQEIDFTKDYLNLVQNNFDHRLRYEINIPPELDHCLIPKFSLQPIVENCITHGFDSNPTDGLVRIAGDWHADQMKITISDNGAGIPAGRLEAIERALPGPCSNQQQDSIGLKNIHHRIQLLHGNDYGLHITSSEGEGTQVELKLPNIQK